MKAIKTKILFEFFFSRLIIAGLILLVSLTLSCVSTNKTNVKKLGQQKTINSALTDADKAEFEYIFFEALKHKMQGNVQQALTAFQNCLKVKPNSAVCLYETGRLYDIQNDQQQALLYAQKAVDADKTNKWYRIFLCELLLKNDLSDKATQNYKELVNQNPTDYDLLYDYAVVLATAKKYKQALDIYSLLETKTGVSENISFSKNRIFFAQNNMQLIYNELNKLINTFPYEIKYRGMLAEYYTANKEYEKAHKIYSDFLAENPDNGIFRLSFGNYYKILGNNDKAFEQYIIAFKDKNVEQDKKIEILLSSYKFTEDSVTENERAMQLTEILIEQSPTDILPLTIKADYLINLKNYTQARILLRKIIQQKKDEIQLWNELLYIESMLLDFEAMYAESSEAVQYYPNQPIIFLFQGIAANRLYKNDDAIRILNYGLDIVIDNNSLKAQFYANLAEVYNRVNKHRESDKAYERLLQLEPDNEFALNNYSYYLALRGDSLQKAKKMIEICVKKHPQNATYLDTYAWVLYKIGDFDLAQNIIENAIANGGSSKALLLEHYGDILYKKNQKEKAVEQWKKALETGKGSDKLTEKAEKGILVE